MLSPEDADRWLDSDRSGSEEGLARDDGEMKRAGSRMSADASRPYRMPAAGFLTPAAFVIANLLIYWSGFEVVWKLGIVLVVGYVLIGISMALDPQRPPLDWKSAVWLPVWLIGLGIVSWQGQYGPGNTGKIPFWWDMLIVAVFSVVIFYWAMATRLPREEMLNLVGRQAEMEMLTAALESAAESQGGVVFITGENGVGKSRLAR